MTTFSAHRQHCRIQCMICKLCAFGHDSSYAWDPISQRVTAVQPLGCQISGHDRHQQTDTAQHITVRPKGRTSLGSQNKTKTMSQAHIPAEQAQDHRNHHTPENACHMMCMATQCKDQAIS